MHYISLFCRVCLENGKSLINIMNSELESQSLMEKLKLCVSEVEWSDNKNLLMCEPCVLKLNTSYEFKKQCLNSSNMMKSYLDEVKGADLIESELRISLSRNDVSQELIDEYVKREKEENPQHPQTYIRIKPNHQLYTPTPNMCLQSKQNSYQNIFLNLIPIKQNLTQIKMNQFIAHNQFQQSMFVRVNNAVQHYYPSSLPHNKQNETSVPSDYINVSQILTGSNSEELSVEVDPTCFDFTSEDISESNTRMPESSERDWEELISSNRIGPSSINNNNPLLTAVKDCDPSGNNKFVPILPKLDNYGASEITNEEKMEFFNSGHFLTQNQKPLRKNISCELCGQNCDNMKSLHSHIKLFHLGKFPYTCEHCMSVFALREDYVAHLNKHFNPLENKDTITLKDLSVQNSLAFVPINGVSIANNEHIIEVVERSHKCDVCSRAFLSVQGLNRHKVRKHEQHSKKKYFIKGVKNAKCEICTREFSTQSYLQLHLKLHYRNGEHPPKVTEKTCDKENVTNTENDGENITETNGTIENEKENDISDQNKILTDKVNTNDINMNDPNKNLDENIETTKNNESIVPEKSQGLKIKINLKEINRRNLHFGMESNVADEQITEASETSETPEVEDIELNENEDTLDLQDEDMADDFLLENEDEIEDPSEFFEESRSTEEINNSDITEEELQKSNVGFKYEIIDGKPKCLYCNKIFSRKHDLKRHINNIHLKSIQYKCHLCNSMFYEAFQLTRHLRAHCNFVFCTECKKKYNTLRDLRNHTLTVHSGSSTYKCGACCKVFYRIKHLKEHMQMHDRSIVYKCHICDESFKESRDLTKHLVEHSGMYSCNFCQKTFATEHELNIHIKGHGSERYECDICHNTYKKKRYLTSHRNNAHFPKQSVEVLIEKVESDFSDDSM